MLEFCKGRFRARLASTEADLHSAQALRFRAFRAGGNGSERDADAFDPVCRHLLVESIADGTTVATCRILIVPQGFIASSYSAQFYDLSKLDAVAGRKMEIGRFCLDPACHDPDVLRLAWAALTRLVDAEGISVLFGCSSFTGTDPQAYGDALAHLAARHVGPASLRPERRVRDSVAISPAPYDAKRALAQLPSLLRTYLAMGGWVGDHVVVDRDLGTLHVFTAVEIGAIPPARVRLLRMDAA